MPTQAQPNAEYRKSSFNALKHGLFAGPKVILPNEDRGQYNRVLESFFYDLAPIGSEEQCVVLRIASLHWRLLRLGTLEARVWNDCGRYVSDQLRQLERFSLYETRLSRTLERERKTLADLREQRRAREEEFEDAADETEEIEATDEQAIPPAPADDEGLKKRENAQNEPKSANDQLRRSYRAQLEEMERKTLELLNS